MEENITDLTTHHIEGYAVAAMERGVDAHFSMPLISQINDTLWMGGCLVNTRLPRHIKNVVSLYPWEKYRLSESLGQNRVEYRMFDSSEVPDVSRIVYLAQLVNLFQEDGPTLVHCQAGLNRSGLIAGASLILEGMPAEDAIALLREKRSPLVLCNEEFEKFLLTWV